MIRSLFIYLPASTGVPRARRQAAQNFAENLRPPIESWKDRGLSQRRMVEVLNLARTPAPKGGEWRL